MSGSRQAKRNGKARKKLPENVVKFKLSRERDEAIERQRADEKAAAIYDDWQKTFIATPKTPAELVDAVNELRAKLETVIPKDSWGFIDQMLTEKLARLHYANIALANTVRVYADCPHKVRVVSEEGLCGWGGVVAIPNFRWIGGDVDFQCPQCGGFLTKKDMALADTVDQEMGKVEPEKGEGSAT